MDHGFAVDCYGKICEDAKEFGLTMNLEFPVISGLVNLPDTLQFLKEVGADNAKVLLDMLYCYWSGVTVEDLKKLDPSLVGVIHLCDCPKNEKATNQLKSCGKHGNMWAAVRFPLRTT